MAARATELTKQPGALRRQRSIDILARQPSFVVGRLKHHDAPGHARMIGAAILCAEKMEGARLSRLECHVLEAARPDIALDAKRRQEEAVNDILRRHDQPDRAAQRSVQLVDLALTAGMLHL